MMFDTKADLVAYAAGTPKTGEHGVIADESQNGKPTKYIVHGTDNIELIEGLTAPDVSEW